MSNIGQSDYTADEIYKLINKRRQVLDLGLEINTNPREHITSESPRDVSSRPREELNNKTIEQYNNLSRNECEDKIELKAEVIELQNYKLSPREHTTRFSGIIVQQAITDKGTKLFLTLQTPQWAIIDEKLLVTAELKRYTRLREIKTRPEDSDEFNLLLENTKKEIHDEKDHRYCLGRLHKRGRRSNWIRNALIMATINNNVIDTVLLHIDGEDYTIKLDKELTTNQAQLYKATGQFGEVKNINGVAPSIWDLPRTKCGK